jgi:hypothetical protein
MMCIRNLISILRYLNLNRQGHYVFTVFRLLTDFVCLYNYEFWLSLCKIVRSSVILLLPLFIRWVIIKKHALFCYYAIKRQISTKLIGENMFYMKAHQLSIVLPSKSRLVQLRIYTCYTKTCFFLGVACYFSRMTYFWSFVLFRCNDFIRSLYYFWTIPKTLIAQHYFCLVYIEI